MKFDEQKNDDKVIKLPGKIFPLPQKKSRESKKEKKTILRQFKVIYFG